MQVATFTQQFLQHFVSYLTRLSSVEKTSNSGATGKNNGILENDKPLSFLPILHPHFLSSLTNPSILYSCTAKVSSSPTKGHMIIYLPWLLHSCFPGFPAIVVAISLAVTQTKGYESKDLCWLDVKTGLIWAFAGPAILVITVSFSLWLPRREGISLAIK